MLCDGYAAYQSYAQQKDKVTLVNCWSHTRRYFEQVEMIDPAASAEALQIIGELYQQEKTIRDK